MNRTYAHVETATELSPQALCMKGVRAYDIQAEEFMRTFRTEQRNAEQAYARHFMERFPHANRAGYVSALESVVRMAFAYESVTLPPAIAGHAVGDRQLFSPATFDEVERRFFAVQDIPVFQHGAQRDAILDRYKAAEQAYSGIADLSGLMYNELLKLNNVTNPNVTFLRLTLSTVPSSLRDLSGDMREAVAPIREGMAEERKQARAHAGLSRIAAEHPHLSERIAQLYAVK